jgi:hypothetical protein
MLAWYAGNLAARTMDSTVRNRIALAMKGFVLGRIRHKSFRVLFLKRLQFFWLPKMDGSNDLGGVR